MLGVGSSVAAWWVARRLSSRRVALAVGAALAVHPALIAFEHAVMSETLALLLGLGSCIFLIRAVERRSAAESFVAGVLAAATLLTRLNLLPLVAVALVLALRSARLDPIRNRAAVWACGWPLSLAWRSASFPGRRSSGDRTGCRRFSAAARRCGSRTRWRSGWFPPSAWRASSARPRPGRVAGFVLSPRDGDPRRGGNRIARRILAAALRERPAAFVTAAARSALVAPGWYWWTANPLWREVPSWPRRGTDGFDRSAVQGAPATRGAVAGWGR
ncbi:MAG: glycosyltransferase family 39 protein [Thermoanaerobaculia bacterium]